MNKVISEIKGERDEKGITTFSYKDIRVDNYQCEKRVSSKIHQVTSILSLKL